MNFCRAKGIIVSPGYGDAINSIVNYCLGITTTEPDSFCIFECFFLKGTDLYPKITLQVDKTKTDEIFDYLKSTYGEHQILRAGVGYRKDHERVPVYAVHACGICIFDRPYYEITETIDIIDKDSGKRTTVPKLTVDELESLGYININILGMSCLTPTSQTLQLIKQNKGENVDFDHIPDDDPATMEFLASENEDIDKIWDCKGIAKDFASVKPSYIEELCAINSLWTINLNDNLDYYMYLVQKDKCDDRFELFEELFSEISRGLILYREQILAILFIMSGLSMAECERIRRQMSTPDNPSAKKTFLDGVKTSRRYNVEEAEQIWDYFMEIHEKTVSMAHYMSLTVLWYRISWLRVHYPEEFSQCYLTSCN
jgi:DNA polymerase-3 subunit alpha